LLTVEYKLILEFFIEKSDPAAAEEDGTSQEEGTQQTPLSFTIPITVNHQCFGRSPIRKGEFSKSQLQTLCLESKCSNIGVIVESFENSSQG
jgi:hypothetical protein